MNKKFGSLLSVLLLICFGSYGHTQKEGLPLQELLKDNRSVPIISWDYDKDYINLDGTPFVNAQRLLIKNRKGLFIFVNGSGRLYQVIDKEGTINFLRLDSTIHFGYNVGSYAFSYNDSIFSLGGYGFWRVNGQLRVFIDKFRQWDVVKLNTEIPLLFDGKKDLIWYDYAAKKIFIGASFERNEAIKTDSIEEAKDNYTVAFLDMQKKEWHHVGKLSSYIIERVPEIKNITSSPWGQLITLGNKVILIDYDNNMLLSLNSIKESILLQGLSNHLVSSEKNIYYCKDSTLFWMNTEANTLDSLPLKKRDFNPTNKPVYFSDLPPISKHFLTKSNWLSVLLAIAVSLSALFLWSFNKSKILKLTEEDQLTTHNEDHQPSPNTNGRHKELFEEKEIHILQLLIENSLKGTTTNVSELNNILGVTQKNIEIQKKQRSDVILSIVKKYAFARNDSSVIIIQKKRSDFDRRSFEYYIEYSRIKDLQTFLNIS